MYAEQIRERGSLFLVEHETLSLEISYQQLLHHILKESLSLSALSNYKGKSKTIQFARLTLNPFLDLLRSINLVNRSSSVIHQFCLLTSKFNNQGQGA